MRGYHEYVIEIEGRVDEVDFNASSPVRVSIVEESQDSEMNIRTDQSGLIGLLRYLHGRGFSISSVTRTGSPEKTEFSKTDRSIV